MQLIGLGSKGKKYTHHQAASQTSSSHQGHRNKPLPELRLVAQLQQRNTPSRQAEKIKQGSPLSGPCRCPCRGLSKTASPTLALASCRDPAAKEVVQLLEIAGGLVNDKTLENKGTHKRKPFFLKKGENNKK